MKFPGASFVSFLFEKSAFPALLNKKLIVLLLCLFIFTFSAKVFSQENDTSNYKTPVIEVNDILNTEKVTPISIETIKREEVEKRYWMQDLPMLINGSTNVNAYSESGSSVGYSYFTIRGFDQRRLSVLLNGTPQNDAEDHQVHWVELSDIGASVENIQIQRGIGTVLFGTSGIGGVINIQTIDFFRNKFINLNAGYGDYNSKRYSFEYSSGLLSNGFGFYGKFSKTNTDGYRNLSWSDHWSYFLSAGKMLGTNSFIKLNVYGSPVKNHMAYLGITRNYLDGKVTGDESADRRYNPITYSNETDNHYKPHYELVFNTQPSRDLFISNTFNYIRGDGYFTVNNPVSKGYDFSYYHLPNFYASDTTTFDPRYYLRNYRNRIDSIPGKGYQVVRSDMVVNLYNNSNDYGWFPKVYWRHSEEKGNLLVGGEVRFHDAEHYGEISFANTLPPGIGDNFRYYFYNAKKKTFSFYANDYTEFSKRLSAMLGIQYTYHKYTIENNKFSPYNFDVDYQFLTSRAGFNFNITDAIKTYAGISIARREPTLKDLYDADSPYSRPYFARMDTEKGIFSDPLIKYEELTDYEFGIGYTENSLRANLNFYIMDYTNEIVSNGQVDNLGFSINWNAGKSVHRGIEMELEYNLLDKFVKGMKTRYPVLTVSGNLSLSDNYFVDYVEKKGVDSIGNVIYGNDYSGNQILLNPQVIGNLSLNYNSMFGLGAYVTMQYIGKQYLDNSENEKKNPSARLAKGYVDKIIEPFTVFNAGLTLDIIPLVNSKTMNRVFKSVEASLKINNIFNKFYETSGGIDTNGNPLWIPAAERNIYLNLKLGF